MWFLSRTSVNPLKETPPQLANYDHLKAHFDWLFDGNISQIVNNNLGKEIKHMEMFLR
jgi:hypothetical protein